MKKLPHNIQSELKNLRGIKPEAAWLVQNKESLLAQLRIPAQAEQPLSSVALLSITSRELLAKLAWQPMGALLVVLAVVGGPSIAAVNAAKGSLPGDALYPVKRSLERARLSFTFSSSKRAELEVGLVANRLHELQRITKEQAPSPARQQKIALAVEELKKDTASVKTRLDAAKSGDSQSNKQQAVALAKIVNEKTADYQETLQIAINELDTEATKSNGGSLSQAMNSVQEVTINALDILVNENENDEKPLSEEELKTQVTKQLEAMKQSVKSFEARIVLAQAEVVPGETSTVLVPNPQQPQTMISQTVVAESPLETALKALSTQVSEELMPLVTYAEELLAMNTISTALETITKANKKIDELSQALEALTQPEEPEPTTEPVEEPVEEPTTEPKDDVVEGEAEAEPSTEVPAESPSESTTPEVAPEQEQSQ